jgi:hypothetical protein
MINGRVQSVLESAMRHYALGNIVEFVEIARVDDDQDLGIGGTTTETRRVLDPEPFIGAVDVSLVRSSNGAFRFSDLRMSCSKGSLTDAEARTEEPNFYVNGERFTAVSVAEAEDSWVFVLRREG